MRHEPNHILPKPTLQKKEDGTNLQPRGRAPAGCSWEAKRGAWVTIDATSKIVSKHPARSSHDSSGEGGVLATETIASSAGSDSISRDPLTRIGSRSSIVVHSGGSHDGRAISVEGHRRASRSLYPVESPREHARIEGENLCREELLEKCRDRSVPGRLFESPKVGYHCHHEDHLDHCCLPRDCHRNESALSRRHRKSCGWVPRTILFQQTCRSRRAEWSVPGQECSCYSHGLHGPSVECQRDERIFSVSRYLATRLAISRPCVRVPPV
jgi:hypothetical protein